MFDNRTLEAARGGRRVLDWSFVHVGLTGCTGKRRKYWMIAHCVSNFLIKSLYLGDFLRSLVRCSETN